VTRRIFGFGSLVTRDTHDYGWLGTARLKGYRRVWVPSNIWDISFLSVEQNDGFEIDGSILEVAPEAWPGLLEREKGYDVHDLNRTHLAPDFEDVSLFVGRPDAIHTDASKPILLSYLDTVMTGFADHFGAERARDFFKSTVGWQAGIRDDRGDPEYPRTVSLRPEIKSLVDEELKNLGL